MENRIKPILSLWQYSLLLLLCLAVGFLYIQYRDIKNERAAIVKLTFYYPYEDGHFYHPPQALAYFAVSNKDGFFKDTVLYQELAEESKNLQTIQDRLNSFLSGPAEGIMRSKSPLEFYTQKVSIPKNDLATLQSSIQSYVNAFRKALKRTHWRASVKTQDIELSDSIHIDVNVVKSALTQLDRLFPEQDSILLQGKKYDLNNPTLFELSIILEQIKWHRYEVEGNYTQAIGDERRKWRQKLSRKMSNDH